MLWRRAAIIVWVCTTACTSKVGGLSDAATPDAAAMPSDASFIDQCIVGANTANALDCFMTAFCRWFDRCSLPFEYCVDYPLTLFPGEAVALTRDRYVAAIAAGTMSFRSDRVRGCLDAWERATCTDVTEALEACRDMWTGLVADGGRCTDSADCATPRASCIGTAIVDRCVSDGVCTAPAAQGMSCEQVGCVPGSHCVAGVCESGQDGAPCSNNAHCDPGLYCADTACAPELAANDPCTADSQCGGGTTCVGESAGAGLCQRAGAPDDACDGACFGYFCAVAEGDAVGTCQAFTAPGESCTSPDQCGSLDATCEQTCQAKRSVGDSCATSSECKFSLFCTAGITGEMTGECSRPRVNGAACTVAGHCASYRCNTETGQCEAFRGCF